MFSRVRQPILAKDIPLVGKEESGGNSFFIRFLDARLHRRRYVSKVFCILTRRRDRRAQPDEGEAVFPVSSYRVAPVPFRGGRDEIPSGPSDGALDRRVVVQSILSLRAGQADNRVIMYMEGSMSRKNDRLGQKFVPIKKSNFLDIH